MCHEFCSRIWPLMSRLSYSESEVCNTFVVLGGFRAIWKCWFSFIWSTTSSGLESADLNERGTFMKDAERSLTAGHVFGRASPTKTLYLSRLCMYGYLKSLNIAAHKLAHDNQTPATARINKPPSVSSALSAFCDLYWSNDGKSMRSFFFSSYLWPGFHQTGLQKRFTEAFWCFLPILF